ncbi:MAG: glucuronate isomerase [Rectinemataceae bacterium]
MKAFLDPDFLLSTKTSVRLYREHAEEAPIFDFHNHLDPRAIAENRGFPDLTEAWLSGDHYKWRVMRSSGESERLITGGASPREKFDAWARTVPLIAGNPLFHWSHLELLRYFGIGGMLLSPQTADEVWAEANRLLATDEFRVRGLLASRGVKTLCTTDDPADSLVWHKAMAADASMPFSVRPTFRPDKLFALSDPGVFRAYVERLGTAAGIAIDSWESLLSALDARIEFFDSLGCRGSDHALADTDFLDGDRAGADRTLRRCLSGEVPSDKERLQFRSSLLVELGRRYARKDWGMQLHIGAMRNLDSRAFARLGPDTGYDAIGRSLDPLGLAALLDALDRDESLPKTILFCLNPGDMEVLASLAGVFSSSSPGRVQLGAAWWFLDRRYGMERQLEIFASYGVLGTSVGMLTDSRSFLSFPRHEYFRRILCDMLGRWVEKGELPDDEGLLGPLIEGLCSLNAKRYFGF